MDNELILKWVKEAGFTTPEYLGDALFRTYSGGFVAFAKLVEQHVRADEREACAKVCDVEAEYWRDLIAMGCAEASDICATEIRSRKP